MSGQLLRWSSGECSVDEEFDLSSRNFWEILAERLVDRDEILNGKTHDTNSHNFARYCFEVGIEL